MKSIQEPLVNLSNPAEDEGRRPSGRLRPTAARSSADAPSMVVELAGLEALKSSTGEMVIWCQLCSGWLAG